MTRRTLPVLAILAALSLGACAVGTNPAPSPIQTDITALANFTLADLKTASLDAHAHGDQTAYQCYDYLIVTVPTITPATPTGTVGAVVLFQQGRDLANGINPNSGVMSGLNLACAPLVISTQTVINQLVATMGGVAAAAVIVSPVK